MVTDDTEERSAVERWKPQRRTTLMGMPDDGKVRKTARRQDGAELDLRGRLSISELNLATGARIIEGGRRHGHSQRLKSRLILRSILGHWYVSTG